MPGQNWKHATAKKRLQNCLNIHLPHEFEFPKYHVTSVGVVVCTITYLYTKLFIHIVYTIDYNLYCHFCPLICERTSLYFE